MFAVPRTLLVIACLLSWLQIATAQIPATEAEPVPHQTGPDFIFGAGAHLITVDALLAAQADLKAALNMGGAAEVDDILVCRGAVEPGTALTWWVGLEEVAVSGVTVEHNVLSAVTADGHEVVLQVLGVCVERDTHSTTGYLMVLRDDFLQVSAALPITADIYNACRITIGDYPAAPRTTDERTCAERAVDWCTDWYPPCGSGSGLNGIIGCAEDAACRNADCHNLACITNAYDCCELGHGETYCGWAQWLTAGQNLEHVTCDTVFVLELAGCIPYGVIKDLVG